MAQTVRITYYGMEGEGKNVTEAKRDAARKVEAALEGDYSPEIIGDLTRYAVLLWREPRYGWGFRTITATTTGRLYGSSHGSSRMEVEKYARRHVADLLQDVTYILEKDREGIRDWHSKQEFQRKYQEARNEGHSDHEAHAIACGMGHLVGV